MPHAGSDSGGDVHYVSSCASGRITRALIADVSGHGAAVAGVAEHLRSIMRRYINVVGQNELMEAINRELRDATELGMHATAIAATYFLPERRLTLSNAGHPPPLLYRARERHWRLLERDDAALTAGSRTERPARPRNIPLGILARATWEPIVLDFEAGDRVLLYTDSAIEARTRSGEEIGGEGLLRLVESSDASRDEIVPALVERLREETGGRPLEDDLTLVLLHGNEARTRLRDDLAAPFRYLDDLRRQRPRPPAPR
jgi:serine phosphatase RsbU (regulator of sigma subunit)